MRVPVSIACASLVQESRVARRAGAWRRRFHDERPAYERVLRWGSTLSADKPSRTGVVAAKGVVLRYFCVPFGAAGGVPDCVPVEPVAPGAPPL
jgi:hypothetical protein